MILSHVRNKATRRHNVLIIRHKRYINHEFMDFPWSHALQRGQPSQHIFVNNDLYYREDAWIRATSGDGSAQDSETRWEEVVRSHGSATRAHSRYPT